MNPFRFDGNNGVRYKSHIRLSATASASTIILLAGVVAITSMTRRKNTSSPATTTTTTAVRPLEGIRAWQQQGIAAKFSALTGWWIAIGRRLLEERFNTQIKADMAVSAREVFRMREAAEICGMLIPERVRLLERCVRSEIQDKEIDVERTAALAVGDQEGWKRPRRFRRRRRKLHGSCCITLDEVNESPTPISELPHFRYNPLQLDPTLCEWCGAERYCYEPSSRCCAAGTASKLDLISIHPEVEDMLKTSKFRSVSHIVNSRLSFAVPLMRRSCLSKPTGPQSVSIQGRTHHITDPVIDKTNPRQSWYIAGDLDNANSQIRKLGTEHGFAKRLAVIIRKGSSNRQHPFLECLDAAEKALAKEQDGDRRTTDIAISINLERHQPSRAEDHTSKEFFDEIRIVLDLDHDSIKRDNRKITLFFGDSASVPAPRSRKLFIDEKDPLYEILSYPVIFPTPSWEWKASGGGQEDAVRVFHCGWGLGKYRRFRPRNNNSDAGREVDYNGDYAAENTDNSRRSFVSATEYGGFHMFERPLRTGKNMLLRLGKLTQVYILDMAARAEHLRLNWYRSPFGARHSRKAAASDVRQAVQQNEAATAIENRRIILPVSFKGGPRGKRELREDALAIMAKYGKPTFFVTMTCNTQWPEIQQILREGGEALNQRPNDRPELIMRVWDGKARALREDIRSGVLGKNNAIVWVYEYQQRGLPHMHLLAWNKHPPAAAEDIDSVVHAELPDPVRQPALYSLIASKMVHNDCSRQGVICPCHKQGKDGKLYCKNNFPKPFTDISHIGVSGFSTIRRRRTGVTTHRGQGNEWVVPYNAGLMMRYQTHINVELTNGMGDCVGYLFKYITKAEPGLSFVLKQEGAREVQDEVTQYQNARVMGSCEAAGRLLSMPQHSNVPAVKRLDIHVKGKETIFFNSDDTVDELAEKVASKSTTLLAWFNFNDKNQSDGCRTLLYRDFPTYFSYVKGEWKLRQGYEYSREESRFRRKDTTGRRWTDVQIGRIFWVSPRDTEAYCLRLILNARPGLKSFDDAMTVDGVVHDTMLAAATALGLFLDDKEAESALEAAKCYSSMYVRYLFAVLISCGMLNCIKGAWERFRGKMCYDERLSAQERQLQEEVHGVGFIPPERERECILDIHQLLSNEDGLPMVNLDEELPLPLPTRGVSIPMGVMLARRKAEEYYSAYEKSAVLIRSSNRDQSAALEMLQNAVRKAEGGGAGDTIFVQAPAGTGKTFLANCFLNWARSTRGEQGICVPRSVIAVASTGIAATLLELGTTAHSRFRLPIVLNDNQQLQVLNITEYGKQWRALQECSCILWDEAGMTDRRHFELLDRTMRRIRSHKWNKRFGGCPMIIIADLQQTLPIVRADGDMPALNASLHTSYLWGGDGFQAVELTKSMRIQDEGYLKWTQGLGKGVNCDINGWTRLYGRIGNSGERIYVRQDLINFVYPQLDEGIIDENVAIASLLNSDVDELNAACLNTFPGRVFEFIAANRCTETASPDLATEDYMSQVTAGLPPQKLLLKVNSPIICTRNIYSGSGARICNGSRLVVIRCHRKVLYCQDRRTREFVLIPRIKLTPEPGKVPFEMERVQFPVRNAFALTVNKLQGQTVDRLGLDLTKSEFFAHGQAYVAFTRVRHAADIRVATQPAKRESFRNPVQLNVISSVEQAIRGHPLSPRSRAEIRRVAEEASKAARGNVARPAGVEEYHEWTDAPQDPDAVVEEQQNIKEQQFVGVSQQVEEWTRIPDTFEPDQTAGLSLPKWLSPEIYLAPGVRLDSERSYPMHVYDHVLQSLFGLALGNTKADCDCLHSAICTALGDSAWFVDTASITSDPESFRKYIGQQIQLLDEQQRRSDDGCPSSSSSSSSSDSEHSSWRSAWLTDRAVDAASRILQLDIVLLKQDGLSQIVTFPEKKEEEGASQRTVHEELRWLLLQSSRVIFLWSCETAGGLHTHYINLKPFFGVKTSLESLSTVWHKIAAQKKDPSSSSTRAPSEVARKRKRMELPAFDPQAYLGSATRLDPTFTHPSQEYAYVMWHLFGLEMRRTGSDGNCLLYAIQNALRDVHWYANADIPSHGDLRHQICEEMVRAGSDSSWVEQYRTDGSWLTNEAIDAAAVLLHIKIVVLQQDGLRVGGFFPESCFFTEDQNEVHDHFSFLLTHHTNGTIFIWNQLGEIIHALGLHYVNLRSRSPEEALIRLRDTYRLTANDPLEARRQRWHAVTAKEREQKRMRSLALEVEARESALRRKEALEVKLLKQKELEIAARKAAREATLRRRETLKLEASPPVMAKERELKEFDTPARRKEALEVEILLRERQQKEQKAESAQKVAAALRRREAATDVEKRQQVVKAAARDASIARRVAAREAAIRQKEALAVRTSRKQAKEKPGTSSQKPAAMKRKAPPAKSQRIKRPK